MKQIREAQEILAQTDKMIKQAKGKLLELKKKVSRGATDTNMIIGSITSIHETLNQWDEE